MRYKLNDKEIKYCQMAFLNDVTMSYDEAVKKTINLMQDNDELKEFPSIWEKNGKYIVVRLRDREYPVYFGFIETDNYASLQRKMKKRI